jgi:hypothetical protein
MSEVKIVRLSSGEEIICKFTDQGDSVLIQSGGVIIPVGEGNIGLAPWLPYANTKGGITVSKQFIVFVVDAQDDFRDQYSRDFVASLSGLVAPKKGLVVPDLKLAD